MREIDGGVLLWLSAVCLAMACAYPAQAATLPGSQEGPVASFTVEVRGTTVVFTVAYKEDVIGMMGQGGMIGIDSDLDIATPDRYWRGYDTQIRFDASTLAPTASVSYYSGPRDGDTIDLGAGFSCTSHSVTISVPLNLVSTGNDFACVFFHTGTTSFGPTRDRIPRIGVLLASTGQIVGLTVTGDASPHAISGAAGAKFVRKVTTAVDGENAVWVVEMNADLPTGDLDFADMMTMRLMIDTDRKLVTGIEGLEVPFVPFGTDISVLCTLEPGGASAGLIDGYELNKPHVASSGGPATSDLGVTNTKREARIVVPFHALGITTTDFHWALLADRDQQAEMFRGSAIDFASGQDVPAVVMPPDAVVVDDPEDCLAHGSESATKALANSEIRKLTAAVVGDLLLVRIAYEHPIVPADSFFTNVFLLVPGAQPEQSVLGINWSYGIGGQVWLTAGTPEEGAKPVPLHQCVANQGKDVYLMVPLSLFSPGPTGPIGMYAITRMVGSKGDAMVPAQFAVIDQAPNTGFISIPTGPGQTAPPAPVAQPSGTQPAGTPPAGGPQQPTNPWGQWTPVAPQ